MKLREGSLTAPAAASVLQGADRDVPRADGRAPGGGGEQDGPAQQPRHGARQVQTRRRQQGGAQGPHTVDH